MIKNEKILRIKRKDIYVEKSELLYENDFSVDNLCDDFEIACGNWKIKNSSITGTISRDNGGLIYSKKHYLGDVLLDFYGKTVLPSDNDLNFTFCSDGWDYEKDVPKDGYIGGLEGWWLGKAGIEKCPYDTNVSALTGMHRFEAGKYYHIQAGRVCDICFMFIDGELAVELIDANPIEKFGRVGLGVYCSKAKFKNFKVYKPYYENFDVSYKQLKRQQNGTKG